MGIKMDEYELLDKDSGPYGITAGKDGALWFTQHKANQIGRITMQGEITEYPIPTQNAEPHGIASGPDGAIWFTEECNKIGRLSLL